MDAGRFVLVSALCAAPACVQIFGADDFHSSRTTAGAGGHGEAGHADAGHAANGGDGGTGAPKNEASCHDRVDDDGDALIDCDDPDCVEAQVCTADAWVDAAAPPGGDGSYAAPFADIGEAMTTCTAGITVFVYPGAYGGFSLPADCVVVGAGRDEVTAVGPTPTVNVMDGGVFARLASLTLSSTAPGFGDGGCLRFDDGNLVLDDVRFTQCQATRGGGIAVIRGKLTGHRVALDGCGALDRGGAVIVRNDGGIDFSESIIGPGNSANQGGGIYLEGDGSSVLLARVTVTGGTAAELGGGIHQTNGLLSLHNVFVIDNHAGTRSGGIHIAGGATAFRHVTIAGNSSAAATPGGIWCDGIVTGLQHNVLIWDNDNGGSEGCPLRTSGLQENPFPQFGNFMADPLFVNPSGGDYHIAPSSPMIGAADPNNSLPEDFDGDARDADPDVGADEVP